MGAAGRAEHPLDHVPLLVLLSVDPPHDPVAQTGHADFEIRARAGHLAQKGLEPIPARGEDIQLLLGQLGPRGRRGRVHER